MPISPTGPITMTDIRTEFGGPTPIVLSNYYAGGANVPAGTTGNLGAIPSSGSISMGHFRGSQKEQPLVVDVSPSSFDEPFYNCPSTQAVVGPATVSRSGGTGTYSYSWVRVSGSPNITATNPTGQSTDFVLSSGGCDQIGVNATFRCTVTSGAQTANTGTVSVTLSHFSGDPP